MGFFFITVYGEQASDLTAAEQFSWIAGWHLCVPQNLKGKKQISLKIVQD